MTMTDEDDIDAPHVTGGNPDGSIAGTTFDERVEQNYLVLVG